MTQTIWAASALLADGWADNVAVEIDDSGNIESISPDTDYKSGQKHTVLIPGIANVHSHAHQRAMAGLGERAGKGSDGQADSFWTWRKIMYHYLERIQPDHLFHIASQLYLEMLKHGYTCVGEFQYLHHGIDGSRYQNPAEMSLQCLQAAKQLGMGFTALPVLYRFGGFGSLEPLDGQNRFINSAGDFIDIVGALQSATQSNQNCSVGIAPHSLRAIDQELLNAVINELGIDQLAAIHIHIAEQIREIDDCLSWSGSRPVQWLLDHFEVDENWCLIHATHMDAGETEQMAKSGCIAGLCPTTEANLGDGFFNALEYFKLGGRWAIGSDSHISIDPVEEFRWLEYGVRLKTNSRNQLVSESQRNTGRYMLDGAWQGSELACGRKIGKIEAGYRADLVVLDALNPRLYGRREDDLLDSWVFSGNDNLVKDVYVGGRHVVENGQHINQEAISQNFRLTLDQLAE